MDIIFLPPHLVPYLDALALPDQDPQEYLGQFQEALASLDGWLNFQGSFSVNDEEAGDLENLVFLLSQIETALQQPPRTQLDAIVPALYQIVSLMDKINRRRDQASYAPQPAINDLILAGAAFLQGRGEARSISERLTRLDEYYFNLRQLFRANKARLVPEVAQSLEAGIHSVKLGKEHAEAALASGDCGGLRNALAELAEGGSIIQFLTDWLAQDEERLAQRHCRFHIPVVGPMLELYLDSARQFPKQQWSRGLRGIYRDYLPQLFLFWQNGEKKIFLPPSDRQALVDEVEAGLEALRESLEIMGDPEASAEQGLEAFEQALEQLSEAFRAIQTTVPRTDHLKGSQAGDYFDLLVGFLDGFVPVVAFSELLHASPPPGNWKSIVEAALDYCGDGDPHHLYVAIDLLLKLHPAPTDEGQPQFWRCPYCQNSNPLGRTTCSACARSPQLISDDSDWKG